MTTQIDTTQFNDTDVIKSLKNKQVDKLIREANSEPAAETLEAPKSNRGRKRKYQNDEERILARRAQQKAYRERKKLELLELRALKASLESESKNRL